MPSLFESVVVASDLEPDDVAMLYMLCARAEAECEYPLITVFVGEGTWVVKYAVWNQVRRALSKRFKTVRLMYWSMGVSSPVDYNYAALDARFNLFEPSDVIAAPTVEVTDASALWSNALSYASLVVVTRPPRELLSRDDVITAYVDAPLYMYGGYNLRCCGAPVERVRALAAKFRWGFHVVERSDFLGVDFDPMRELPKGTALTGTTPFGGMLRGLCAVWNGGMATYKTKKLLENFNDESAAAEYLADPTLDCLCGLMARGLVKKPERAVMDHISLDACKNHPETSLLWADPLVVTLVGANVWGGPQQLVDCGSGDTNPTFVKSANGAFRVPEPWILLNYEEKAARKRMVEEACAKWFA